MARDVAELKLENHSQISTKVDPLQSASFVEAVKLLKPHCDAVDLNLGCPQHIARKGHYGAFLMLTEEDRKLVGEIISKAKDHHFITVKIRVFDSLEETLNYAQG